VQAYRRLRVLTKNSLFIRDQGPMMSMFTAVEMAPRDPILGLNEQFAADTNPNKVNLGVGVYFDDNGKLPLLECVQAAENAMMAKPSPAMTSHSALRTLIQALRLPNTLTHSNAGIPKRAHHGSKLLGYLMRPANATCSHLAKAANLA